MQLLNMRMCHSLYKVCTKATWLSCACRASFLWKGYHLEHKLGSARFAVAVGFLLVLSQVLVVVVAFALTRLAHVHVRLHDGRTLLRIVELTTWVFHDAPAQ